MISEVIKIVKNIFLSFDVEEFDSPLERKIPMNEKEQFWISKKGLLEVLTLLETTKIKATFFVTARFAMKYPSLIRQIAKKHYIGCHGYSHCDNYSKMSEQEIISRLKNAKKIIEKICRKKILAFRSQRTQKINYKLLKKAGFSIDSSLIPTFIYFGKYKLGRFENLFTKRVIHCKSGIKVYPIATTPILPFIYLRLPLTWITFRNLGLLYAKICSLLGFLWNDNLTINFHPWEFSDLKKYNIGWLVKKNTGEYLLKELFEYISWAKNNNFAFKVIS